MKSRRFWYVMALSVLCLVAARIVMAQDQGNPPPDQGYPQQQGYPPQAQGYPAQQPGYPPPDQAGQPGGGAQEQGPPPGAARIAIINGEVSTQRGDSGEWVAAVVNAPVMQGDVVATTAQSRTEIQLDFANVLRLNQNAQVKIAALEPKHIQLQVGNGVVTYTVFRGSEAEVEIDTPNMAVIPQGEGVYRIQVDGPGQTGLTVREGQAQVSTPEGSTTVERGQVIAVRGTDHPEYQVAGAAPADDWDRWTSERDRAIESAQSWQYTNRYYAGAQDLDQYGTWQNTPDYGNVWTPNVGPDWTPYSDGNWAWEPYWGWTWVSYEPWGWAPYHYGRWGYWGGRWSWWPGVGYGGLRPFWAPAMVSFLGFGWHGLGVGLGFGFGSIGWFPLGPFDRMFGWWGHGNGYHSVGIGSLVNVNAYNRGYGSRVGGRFNSNLQAALSNPGMRRAITTMPGDQFGRGGSRNYGRGVDKATLRGGRMVQGTLPVVPTRASLMPGNRLARPSAIPSRGINSTHFFSRNPVNTRTESFNQRAAQIQQMVRQNPAGNSNYGARAGANAAGRAGNPGAGGASGLGNANRGAYGNARPATPYGQSQSGNSTWQRYGGSTPYGGMRSQPQAGTGQAGGWGQFSRQGPSAPSNRGGGWNAPAPRTQYSAPSGGRYSGYGSGGYGGGYGNRPSLNMRKPIVVQRAAPRSYGSGGGSGSRTTGGGRSYSAPSGGGGHSGGGGGHSGGGHGKR